MSRGSYVDDQRFEAEDFREALRDRVHQPYRERLVPGLHRQQAYRRERIACTVRTVQVHRPAARLGAVPTSVKGREGRA